MDAECLLKSINDHGVTLIAFGAKLVARPGNLLTANDEALIREHKPALLRLLRLQDAETLHSALAAAGTAGLAWREGTPADWSDDRLSDAGEVLYSDGRMIHRNGRRYPRDHAPERTPMTGPVWDSATGSWKPHEPTEPNQGIKP